MASLSRKEGDPAYLDPQAQIQIKCKRVGLKYVTFDLKIVFVRHIICLVV